MESIYLLIPLALIFVTLIIWLLMWAIKSGQFDDMEGPAYRILEDDELVNPPSKQQPEQKKDD